MKTNKKGLLSLVGLLLAGTNALQVDAQTLDSTTTNASTDASVTFEGGRLTIESAPSNLTFNDTIKNDEKGYSAETISGGLKVSDLRGTGEGWHVMAELSGFKNEGNESSLAGATITFNKGSVDELNKGEIAKISPSTTSFRLEKGGGIPVFTASSGQGLGVWETNWENTTITLDVPTGSATVGDHKATITWSLVDGPNGNE